MKQQTYPGRATFLVALLALVGSWAACSPEEQEPAYVEFEGFNFVPLDGQGTASADIEQVWVFADNVFLGTYDLPARIPMLVSGETELRFEAGILQDGISARPEIYPFYESIEREVELFPGRVWRMGRQDIGYRDDMTLVFVEDFESDTEREFNIVTLGQQAIQATTEDVFEGQFSGKIELSDSINIVELLSDTELENIFEDGQEPRLWMELDFKSESSGLVGVVGENRLGEESRQFDPGFLPRDDWSKIYFNLSSMYVNADVERFRVGIRSFLSQDMSEAAVYLDNIKLLYR